jgi:ArsR family transcriptional regulator
MNIKLIQLKALADANRLKMVQALFHHPSLCACQIIEWLGVTGATISRHLQQLQLAGLVDAEKDGRWVHFSLSSGFPTELRAWLKPGLTLSDLETLEAILKLNPSDLCRKQREPNS